MKNLINNDGYTLVPPPEKLSGKVEQEMTIFATARNTMIDAGISIGLPSSDDKYSVVMKSTRNDGELISIDIWKKNGDLFVRNKNVKDAKYFKITKDTADFLNNWIALNIKVFTCLEIYKIFEPLIHGEFPENGPLNRDTINNELVVMMKNYDEKNKLCKFLIRDQKYEEAGQMRDELNKIKDNVVNYLITKYPKELIFQNNYIKDAIFERDTKYTVNSFY